MLSTTRTIASLVFLSIAALVIGSCAGEPTSPTAPSSVTTFTSLSPATESGPVAPAGEQPAPGPLEEGDDPPMNGDPPPEPPAPTPGPAPPAPAPGPAPTPPPPSPAPAPAPAPPPGNGFDPGPPPRAQPGVPVPTPPGGISIVTIKVDPEPVPYSGRAITDVSGCRILPHTWFYVQILHNNTGRTVTFTESENFFDGRFTSKNGSTIRLEPNGTFRRDTKWCSGYPTFHYAQTRYKGRDEDGNPITLSGPWVRLNPR